MEKIRQDEWSLILSLLPEGWEERARETKAFRRARAIPNPSTLLRLLLFHAVNDQGLRNTVEEARLAGLAQLSPVAFLKRLRRSAPWLIWLTRSLCRQLRQELALPHGLRPRVLDGTTIQAPASEGTNWRLHYTLDLFSLDCDWLELTGAHGSEALERAPYQRGDVILADRNFLRPRGVRTVRQAEAHVLVRIKWRHPRMTHRDGRTLRALTHARRLRVGEIGEVSAWLEVPEGPSLAGRLVLLKLPAPLAHRSRQAAQRRSQKKGHQADRRSLEAAQYVMLFTTLPKRKLSARKVLELYRARWQVELAFKRLKQLLKIGYVPHQDPQAARGWLLSKLLVSLLLEKLYRNALFFSPWGYELPAEAETNG